MISDDEEAQFLFQRRSITLQRFNAILLHESFESDVPLPDQLFYLAYLLTLGIYTTEGTKQQQQQ